MAFQVVEYALQEFFLTALFQGGMAQISSMVIASMPVKQARIDLPNSTQNIGANWTTSCVITGHLVAAS